MNTLAQEESRARRRSLTVSLVFWAGFFVLAYLWVLVRGTIPPEDENPYVVAGRIDFGYMETPGSATPRHTGSATAPEPVVTRPTESPVKTPTPKPTPTPSSTESTDSDSEESEEEEEVESETFQPGGSPDASQPGDLGSGLLEFGEGDEGLQNRRLIHFVAPRYTAQKEARIKFEIFILPDGSVSHARALSLQAPPELKAAGVEAIQQWRFSPVRTNQIQRVTVTIRFRLR